MLAERIAVVAPNMPSDIRRWFLQQDYAKPSIQDQDWDLMLAEWDYVPLLIEYIGDPVNPLETRFEAFSALMVLQALKASGPGAERRKRLTEKIRRVVLRDQEFARKVAGEWLGLVEALTIRRMLGDSTPEDVPRWIHDEVTHRA